MQLTFYHTVNLFGDPIIEVYKGPKENENQIVCLDETDAEKMQKINLEPYNENDMIMYLKLQGYIPHSVDYTYEVVEQ